MNNNMKKLMPIIFILVSVGVFVFFVDPQYKQIKEVDKTIEENKKLITLAEDLRRERDNLQEQYNDIGQEDRAKLLKILPDTVDNVRLILDINNIAEDFGIAITNIGVQENNNKDGRVTDNSNSDYGTIGITFSVSAKYDVFKLFMQKLENSMRLVDIQSFSVSAGDGLFYNFNVSMNTYWLK